MLTTFKEYVKLLETLHNGIRQTLVDLPPEALDWKAGPDMNSLGVLATHLAGSERYWIGTVAGEDPLPRNRDAEFETGGVGVDMLLALLDEALANSKLTLAQLTPLHLDENRGAPRDEREVTVAWALLHALEHTALHLGHMQLTRQLWDGRQENSSQGS